MVAGLCLPGQHFMVDLVAGRIHSHNNCFTHDHFPGNKSSDGKPGEEFENGMNANVKIGKCENWKMKIQVICWFTNSEV